MSTDDICRTCGKPGAVEMRCRRLPCIWADTVAAALELDMSSAAGSHQTGPALIEAVIVNTHDRAPGGTQASDEVRAGRMEACEDRTCPEWNEYWRHDHPVPVDPTGDAAMRPSRSEADLAALRDAVSAWITSVGHLVALSVSRPPGASWGAAISDAVLLDEMGAIGVLESNGLSPRRWVVKAGDAIEDLRRIRDRHVTREANDWERSATAEFNENDACKVCRQLGLLVDARRAKGGAGGLCQGCYRLRKRCAEVNDIDTAEAPVPKAQLVEELRRIGAPGSPADRAARSRWFQAVGEELRGRRLA